MINIPLLQLILYILRMEASQYTIAVSHALVWNYSSLTASMTAPQATVSLRLVFNAILIFSVCLYGFNDNNIITMIMIIMNFIASPMRFQVICETSNLCTLNWQQPPAHTTRHGQTTL